MADMGWDKAIKKVLASANGQMHYKEIAEEIEKQGLRKSLGATPANTVNVYINGSLNNDKNSDYVRTSPGFYSLKSSITAVSKSLAQKDSDKEEKPTGLIQSFGMYWRASEVVWKNKPKILGQQQSGSEPIDFSEQIGVYILYDRDRVIYVGRTTDRSIGQRLNEHTKGRMNGRWDRFSWFGLKSVTDAGELSEVKIPHIGSQIIIETFEALLIETLEPPQNRKRGDQFSATEFLQAEDPEKNSSKKDALTALMATFFSDK